MTKKEHRAARESWQAALAEGRILRFEDGRMVSYPTIAARDAAALEALAALVSCSVVLIPNTQESL